MFPIFLKKGKCFFIKRNINYQTSLTGVNIAATGKGAEKHADRQPPDNPILSLLITTTLPKVLNLEQFILSLPMTYRVYILADS